jgi:hypothetical protein
MYSPQPAILSNAPPNLLALCNHHPKAENHQERHAQQSFTLGQIAQHAPFLAAVIQMHNANPKRPEPE